MINKNRLYLDVHAIQTLPPSNINRDDTGSPKTAQYGGVRRARVSSQSWKRAIRGYFNENGEESNVGLRTLSIVDYVASKIIEKDNTIGAEDAVKMAETTLNLAGIKTTKEHKVKALFFLGDEQANRLAQASIEGVRDKNELKEIINSNPSVDIALFGRMVADDPSLNEDASCQVAHAISTHAVQNEFDFYTAIDDLSAKDNSGAGMLGNIEYNSSTMYRYANIAIHELSRQLGDIQSTINTIKLFIEAFSNSLPTGKINTFANQTIPDAVIIFLREDRPINAVGAFEEPVRSYEGFAKKSIEKLSNELIKAEKFVKKPLYSAYVSMEEVESLKNCANEMDSLEDLKNNLEGILAEKISGMVEGD